MKRNSLLRGMIYIVPLMLAFCMAGAAASAPPSYPCAPGQLLVQYRAGLAGGNGAMAKGKAARDVSLKKLDTKFGLRSRSALGIERAGVQAKGLVGKLAWPERPSGAMLAAMEVLQFDVKNDMEAAAAAYRKDPNVLRAEPNYKSGFTQGARFTPNDPYFKNQDLDFTWSHFPQAWNLQKGDPATLVAVLDSGVDAAHPDMVGVVSPLSFDFVNHSPAVFDDLGHGSRVASLIGANGNNGIGMTGAAFGVKLLVLDIGRPDGSIFNSDVAEALDYAIAQKVKVINMSFTSAAPSALIDSLIQEAAKTAVLVAAVGNEGTNTVQRYPAAYENVIGVAASQDGSSLRAPFSNYNGPLVDYVDLAAAGTTQFSAFPGGQYDGFYGSGTSFAAPMVASAAALLIAKYPLQSPASIAHQLFINAFPERGVKYTNYGHLSAWNPLLKPLQPTLDLFDVTVDDSKSLDPDNDGDGNLDKGESVRIVVTLQSSGADVTGLTLKLATVDPIVTGPITSDTAHLEAVRLGEFASNKAESFGPVTIAPGAEARRVAFTLTIDADGGFHKVVNFDLSTENEIALSGALNNFHFENIATYRLTGDVTLSGANIIDQGTRFKVNPDVAFTVGSGASLAANGTAARPIEFTSSEQGHFFADPPYTRTLGPQSPAVIPAVGPGGYVRLIYVSATTGSDAPGQGDGTLARPYATIRNALAQNTGADTNKLAVLVATGLYTGDTASSTSLTLKPYIDIYGGFNPANWGQRDVMRFPTILDGQAARRVVLGADNVLLDGVTVARGDSVNTPERVGAGLLCNFTSPTIRNCVFVNNNAPTQGGGGIYLAGSNALIQQCVIAGNRALYAGGLGAEGGSPVLDRNVVCDNYSGAGSGGAVFFTGGRPTLRRNAIYGNVADPGTSEGDCLLIASAGADNNRVIANGNLFGSNRLNPNSLGVVFQDSYTDQVNNVFLGGVMIGGGASDVKNCDIQGPLTSDPNSPSAVSLKTNNLQSVSGFSVPAGNITVPSKNIGRVTWGSYRTARLDTLGIRTVLGSISSRLTPGSLAAHVLNINGQGYYIITNDLSTITVFGDATQGGTVALPGNFEVNDFHIRKDSLLRGKGTGPAVDADIKPEDIEGDVIAGAVTDIGCDLFSEDGPQYFVWGAFTVAGGAGAVNMTNTTIENGRGMQNSGSNTRLTAMTFHRNRDFGLNDTSPAGLAAPLTNSAALENLASGILAPLTDIENCTANDNGGVGLSGRNVKSSTAANNTDNGIVAVRANLSTSSFNQGGGFVLTGGAGSVLTALYNGGSGITANAGAESLADSLAALNTGAGIEYTGRGGVRSSTSQANGGAGILYASTGSASDTNSIFDCLASDNLEKGIEVSGTAVDALNCVVENNTGDGITRARKVRSSRVRRNDTGIVASAEIAGTSSTENNGPGITGLGSSTVVRGSSVSNNQGDGIISPLTVSDTWVENNRGSGIVGSNSNVTIVDHSVMRGNAGFGVLNLLRVNLSSIYGNHSGVEASDDLTIAAGSTKNFSNVFWGVANTNAASAHNPGFNENFLDDAHDHPGQGGTLNIWPMATSFIAPNPFVDDPPPSFLSSVTPGPSEPVNAKLTKFTFTFSQTMDVSVNPRVSFDQQAPFTKNVVTADPGWITFTTWVGSFPVDNSTGDGAHIFRVSGARSAAGGTVPDDTSHQFVVDTSGAFVANNGIAQITGPVGRIEWDGEGAAPRPAAKGAVKTSAASDQSTLGFNVVRSSDGGVTWTQVNAALIPNSGLGTSNSFLDLPLDTNKVYFWMVYRVLPDNSSIVYSGPMVQISPPTFNPSFVIDNATVVEGTGGTTNAVFTVTLVAQAGAASVNYSTVAGSAAAGSDFTAKSGTLNFPSGTTTQTISVPIRTDSTPEANESFTVQLSSPSGADIAFGTGTGVITNDDGIVVPKVSFTTADTLVQEAGTIVMLNVHLDIPPIVQTRVNWTTMQTGLARETTDFVAASGTLIFLPPNQDLTIPVSIVNDAVWEGAENFQVRLENPAGCQVVEPYKHTITIVEPAANALLSYLLGLSPNTAGLDSNGDGRIDSGDVVRSNTNHP